MKYYFDFSQPLKNAKTIISSLVTRGGKPDLPTKCVDNSSPNSVITYHLYLSLGLSET